VVRQRIANPLHVGSNPILTSPVIPGGSRPSIPGECDSVCTSVCTPTDEATLEGAIARLTTALITADDQTIAELVVERRALRDELRALREQMAGVVHLDDERARRGAPK
jgi:hypothetical protein